MNEEGFVSFLKDNFKFSKGLGIGDDCSVIKIENEYQLISKDLLIENVHFSLDYFEFEEIGKKSISVNVSDILAMGGKPEYFYLGIGFPFKRFKEKSLLKLFNGIKEFSDFYSMELAGGDLTDSEKLVISITIIGRTKNPIMRSNAKEGDLICVSGYLGESALGLELLKKKESDNYFTLKHKTPVVDVDIAETISRYANSMIDVSDGLLKDLGRILLESDKGAEIYFEKIKYKKDFYKICEINGLDYRKLILSGGEDYVLLFTLSSENFFKLKNEVNDIYEIGIINNTNKLKVFENNKEIDFDTKGFDHFSNLFFLEDNMLL